MVTVYSASADLYLSSSAFVTFILTVPVSFAVHIPFDAKSVSFSIRFLPSTTVYFKLSTAGMPIDRLLAARVDEEIVPLRLVGIDNDQLVLGTDVDRQVTLSDVIALEDNNLNLVVRDDAQQLHAVFGYRVVAEQLVLG